MVEKQPGLGINAALFAAADQREQEDKEFGECQRTIAAKPVGFLNVLSGR